MYYLYSLHFMHIFVFFVLFSCIIGTCRKTVGPGRDWGLLHLNICLGAGQMLRWMLWGVFWEHDTNIYGQFWSHIGTISGSFLDHFMWYVCHCLKDFGIILDTCWYQFRATLGLFSRNVATCFEICWDLFINILGAFS